MEATLTIQETRPPSLVESFESVWVLDPTLTTEHWRYLWQRYGVAELVDIGRRSGWLTTENDRDAVLELLKRSQEAGFDPLADGLSTEAPPRSF